MLGKNFSLFVVLFAACIFVLAASSCGREGAAKETVKTQISDLGFAETVYDPPETLTLPVKNDAASTWAYAYTAEFPSAGVFTVIGDTDLSAVEEKLYFYEDADGSSISFDEYGRFRSYMVNHDLETRPWVSASLTEGAMFQTLEEAAEAFGLTLSEYPDVHFATSPFAENGSSSSFDLYEDEESPVSDSVYAQFDREGALNSIVVTYSNLDSVSEQDEEYFAGLLNGYLQAEGITASYTVESNYRERQDILMANLSVTFTDEDVVWSENYVAGKPLS